MIDLDNVAYSYGGAELFSQVRLSLAAGSFHFLTGPSGAGKTTLLKLCYGELQATSGQVRLFGEDAAMMDRDAVAMSRRRIGVVHQDCQFLDHLPLTENIALPLTVSGREADAEANLGDLLGWVGLRNQAAQFPPQLSGGERQRVAIARAIAMQPQLLLMDEPLASLDAARRQEIFPWLSKLRDELKMPMLYVTHSMEEVARLADHLLVLHSGRVKASGPAGEVLASVDNPSIVGEDAGVLLSGRIARRDEAWQLSCVDFSGGSLWVRDQGWEAGRAVRLRVLARDVSLAIREPRDSSIQNQLRAVITDVINDDHPSQVLVRLDCAGTVILARVTRRAMHSLNLGPGTPVWALVKSVAVIG